MILRVYIVFLCTNQDGWSRLIHWFMSSSTRACFQSMDFWWRQRQPLTVASSILAFCVSLLRQTTESWFHSNTSQTGLMRGQTCLEKERGLQNVWPPNQKSRSGEVTTLHLHCVSEILLRNKIRFACLTPHQESSHSDLIPGKPWHDVFQGILQVWTMNEYDPVVSLLSLHSVL